MALEPHGGARSADTRAPHSQVAACRQANLVVPTRDVSGGSAYMRLEPPWLPRGPAVASRRRISEFGGCWINSNVPGFNEAYASASCRLGGPEASRDCAETRRDHAELALRLRGDQRETDASAGRRASSRSCLSGTWSRSAPTGSGCSVCSRASAASSERTRCAASPSSRSARWPSGWPPCSAPSTGPPTSSH